MQDFSNIWDYITNFISNNNGAFFYAGTVILYALITLIIGLLIIGRIDRLFQKILTKRKVDETLSSFFISLINISLKILLAIIVITMLGIETTSIVAVIAAAGFAVGLALQGSLSNFAGGVLIIFFKPYKVGDYIEAQGHAGTVKSIQIFNTVLKTPDNKTITIPNGAISNSSIINYSTEKTRRIDLTFGIGYEDDFEQAKAIINKLITNDDRILQDPAPFVRVSNLSASSVDIVTRIWVERTEYGNVYHDMIENVKKEFDKNKISFPFPQSDVHLYKHD